MPITKRDTYEQGIARIDQALHEGFWLEASWITYAMFEDRCDSLLEKSGGPVATNHPSGFVSINQKISELKKRSSSDQFLSQVSGLSELLDEVHDWKERRNPIMHSMVEMPRDWGMINVDTKGLAKDGRKILGRFAAAAMKVRKKFKKFKQAGN